MCIYDMNYGVGVALNESPGAMRKRQRRRVIEGKGERERGGGAERETHTQMLRFFATVYRCKIRKSQT